MLGLLSADIWAKLGRRFLLLLGLLVCAAIFEGGSTILLLPLLHYLGISVGDQAQAMTDQLFALLGRLGLPVDLSSLLVVVGVALVLQFVFSLAQIGLSSRLQRAYSAMWRQQLFHNIMAARWPFFLRENTGRLINSLIGETSRLGHVFYCVGYLLFTAIYVVVYLAMALYVSWAITLCIMAVGAVIILCSRLLMRRAMRVGRNLTGEMHAIQSAAVEFLSGAKLIKATATEERAVSAFAAIVQRLLRLETIVSFDPLAVRAFFNFVGVVALVAMLILGMKVLQVPPAEFTIVVALFVRLFPRVAHLQENWQNLHLHLPALAGLQALDNDVRAMAEARATGQLPQPHGPAAIVLDQVQVRGDEAPILHDVSLTPPAGALIGLVGPSGGGKSTLADAILGLVDHSDGSLTIDGCPLQELDLNAWRRQIGFVAQDTVLFNATVRENIAWTFPEASLEDIRRAAQAAQAHGFIQDMDQGYDTVVGDRGLRLSGGQRQRLGIARALVGEKRLLILDEATSALDPKAEAHIAQVLEQLRGRVTILVIAHRLSMVQHADHIYVVDQGRVVEHGTFDHLLRSQGQFVDMWRLQQVANAEAPEPGA